MIKKRILILYSKGGGGLQHLAKNLATGINKHFGKTVTAESFDPFFETAGIGNLLFGEIYNFFLKKSLTINSYMVTASYLLKPDKNPLVKRDISKALNKKVDLRTNAIICTSPWLIEGVFAFLKKTGLKIPVIVYVADFGEGMYDGWFHKKVLAYFTPCINAKEILINLGAKPDSIKVTGLPIPKNNKKRKDHNNKQLRVLVSGGLYGSRRTKAIVASLVNSNLPILITAVCGTNKSLYKKTLRLQKNNKLRVFGRINKKEFSELVQNSDLIITKPGSMTIATAIACSTPLIVISPSKIMPQEKGNLRFVIENKIGYFCKNNKGINETVEKICSNQKLAAEMTARMKKLRNFTDTKRICKAIFSEIRINE